MEKWTEIHCPLSHRLYDGDICSPKIGHLYFVENRTFLLWLDSGKFPLLSINSKTMFALAALTKIKLFIFIPRDASLPIIIKHRLKSLDSTVIICCQVVFSQPAFTKRAVMEVLAANEKHFIVN